MITFVRVILVGSVFIQNSQIDVDFNRFIAALICINRNLKVKVVCEKMEL